MVIKQRIKLKTPGNYPFDIKQACRGARHCERSEAISIILCIKKLFKEIASSAFGPPRNDGKRLSKYNVANGENTLPAITYILSVTRLRGSQWLRCMCC